MQIYMSVYPPQYHEHAIADVEYRICDIFSVIGQNMQTDHNFCKFCKCLLRCENKLQRQSFVALYIYGCSKCTAICLKIYYAMIPIHLLLEFNVRKISNLLWNWYNLAVLVVTKLYAFSNNSGTQIINCINLNRRVT